MENVKNQVQEKEIAGVNWIHLSDLHMYFDTVNKEGVEASDAKKYLSAFLRKENIKADYMFITGDFRFAPEQISMNKFVKEIVDYIKELAGAVGITCMKKIFIVPGNHDLSIMEGQHEERRKIIEDIRKEYRGDIGKIDEKKAKKLLENFTFFKKILQELYGDSYIWTEELWPTVTYKNEDGFSVVCVNTNLIFNNDKGDKNQLLIGGMCLRNALEEIKKEKGNIPIIILAHHGMLCLEENERRLVERLFSNYNVKLYLCGDAHKVWDRTLNKIPEITMGCVGAQEGVDAAFCIGRLLVNGEFSLKAFSWNYGTWAEFTHFNSMIKKDGIGLLET